MGDPLIDMMTAKAKALEREIQDKQRLFELQIKPQKEALEKVNIALSVAQELTDTVAPKPLPAATKAALAQDHSSPEPKESLTAQIMKLVQTMDADQNITSGLVHSVLQQRGAALPEKNAKVQITTALTRIAAKGGLELVERGDASTPSVFKRKG